MALVDEPNAERLARAAFSTLFISACLHAGSAVVAAFITASVTIGGIHLSDRTGGLLHLLNELRSATFAVGAAALGILAGAVLVLRHPLPSKPASED